MSAKMTTTTATEIAACTIRMARFRRADRGLSARPMPSAKKPPFRPNAPDIRPRHHPPDMTVLSRGFRFRCRYVTARHRITAGLAHEPAPQGRQPHMLQVPVLRPVRKPNWADERNSFVHGRHLGDADATRPRRRPGGRL